MSRTNDISSDNFYTKGRGQRKAWPEGCIWPEPVWDSIWGGNYWDVEDADLMKTDEDMEDLLEIREYMDSLVDEGRLNADYSLNEDYVEEGYSNDEETEQSIGDEEEPFSPEKGIDYWDDGFNVESWEDDLIEHINLIKIPASTPDPVSIIRDTIGYEFINENLMRQAFTRRAFGTVYGVGNSEELEFLGDSVLNMIVTREMARQFSEVVTIHPHAPFQSRYSEGEMTKIRSHFVNKEHLAARAALLGLDKYILYGPGETENVSAVEDMMEALLGAVAVDSGWDWHVLEEVADRLVCIQITIMHGTSGILGVFRTMRYTVTWDPNRQFRITARSVSPYRKIGKGLWNPRGSILMKRPGEVQENVQRGRHTAL